MASRDRCRNLPRKGRNTENYRPETGIRQRNLRECRGFSHTGKYHPGDRTAWLTTQSAANRSHPVTHCFPCYVRKNRQFSLLVERPPVNIFSSSVVFSVCYGLSLLYGDSDYFSAKQGYFFGMS